jgi:GxxExxY protein
MLHEALTGQILKAFYKVYNTLGYGFLEKVYENALRHELQTTGVIVYAQHPIKVHYDGVIVGEYVADLLVEELVIIELKVAESISQAHISQLDNYLRATAVEVGLLLNFGPEPTFKRRILTNSKKPHLKTNP